MTFGDIIPKKINNATQKKESKMPGFMDVLSLFTGAIGAGVSAWQGMEDRKTANDQFNREMAFNTETRNTTWEREDNQLQRAKADAIAAGFSPLTAVGNTASGGGTVSAPGSNATRTPIDMSGLMGALQMQQQEELAREEMQNQRQMNKENLISAEKIAGINADNSKAIADADREERKAEAQAQRDQQAEEFRQNMEKMKEEFNKNDEYRNAMLTEQINARTAQEEYNSAMQWQEWYKENKLDGAPYGKYCSTWEEYNRELNAWYTRANAFLGSLGEDKETTSKGETKAGLGLEKIAEIGGSITTETKTKTTPSDVKWRLWLRANPQPIPPKPDGKTTKNWDYTGGATESESGHSHTGGSF